MSDISNRIKPTDDRVLLKGISEIDTSVSGIIIPETASKDRPQKGEILAIGPGKMGEDGNRIPMQVKVGDKVLFSKYAPDEINVDGEDYIIAREDHILAIID
ncbi:co-chaperone GroES [Candidatus Peregrinibacteria bacterium]|nr:co-chaperone GroES [Candidatus Peregrinibacteria bacterium]